MGLSQHSVNFLMREGLRRPFNGTIVTLGKQDVWVTHKEVIRLAKKLDYSLRKIQKVELSLKIGMNSKGFISDRTLFSLLGFDTVISLDASKYENADFQSDLNQEKMESHLLNIADLVLDPGTIEHVFHVPNALKNIFQILRIGGRIIHISPSSNHMDHGFYMFSPTLFWDYYHANKCEVHLMEIIKYKPQAIFNWEISAYVPGSFNAYSFGGLDDSMYAVACIATKHKDSTSNIIPQQFSYSQNLWKSKETPEKPSACKDLIKKSRLLYRAGVIFVRFFKIARLRSMFNKQ